MDPKPCLTLLWWSCFDSSLPVTKSGFYCLSGILLCCKEGCSILHWHWFFLIPISLEFFLMFLVLIIRPIFLCTISLWQFNLIFLQRFISVKFTTRCVINPLGGIYYIRHDSLVFWGYCLSFFLSHRSHSDTELNQKRLSSNVGKSRLNHIGLL